MQPKIMGAGTLYRKNPSTGEYERVGEIKDMTDLIEDDLINDDVIYTGKWVTLQRIKPKTIIETTAKECSPELPDRVGDS